MGVPDLSGATIATPLLFKIFNTLDYDSDAEWFQAPAGIDIRQVCSETGLPPASHCQDLTSDYFIPLMSTTKLCDNRRELMVSPDEKTSYCRNCAPDNGYKKKWYKVSEPEMISWMEDNRIAYERMPAHNPDCELVFKGSAPIIHFPVNGTEYLINKKNPEPLQLVCKTANDVSKIYWYVDNKFYKSCSAGEKQFFIPKEGPVKISCTDDKGRNRDIRIMVKYVSM
ncbi:MAG TPA: hypothetical protein VFO70_04950 [Chitinophagaceae bacterium]|nr:hypothetical protein [Chitinophagaceae bacterium]